MNTVYVCDKCGWPAIKTDDGWVHAYAADAAWCILFAGGRLAAQTGGNSSDCE